MSNTQEMPAFDELGLAAAIVKAIQEVGYETPSPIQAESIPPLLDGRDLLGQAQTGTGKTAAFALPLLSRIDTRNNNTQMLVLAPTRELAIQVAEACQKYAHHLKDFHVLPIYGGQSYSTQLRQLRRGAQVVVGTPGRVMDHMRRGTLKLDQLQSLVLDEADEMLRMGFIDDVEWVLDQIPTETQIALFSATMPKQIRHVAEQYLKEPEIIKIAAKTTTAKNIRQRYWTVSGIHKLDALTRILEMENFDGMIMFVRTKVATEELAEKLAARGYAAAALNGDIPQNRREQIVNQLKSGKLDILVATDVVARGLDVERISHVINYDVPYDTESYVHRIGRTGRAGRSGEAILFVAPRERRMLRAIERATRQPIEQMELPTKKDINQQRIANFKQRITDTLDNADLDFFSQLIQDYEQEAEVDPIQLAAALAFLAQGEQPLLLNEQEREPRPARDWDNDRVGREGRGEGRGEGREGRRDGRREGRERRERKPRGEFSTEAKSLKDHPEVTMKRFKLSVGYDHGVKPGNIVGAIANEAHIDSDFIGHIEIFNEFTTVDLPADLNKETMQRLSKAWVCQQRLNIRPADEKEETLGLKKPAGKKRFGDKPLRAKPFKQKEKLKKFKRRDSA